MNDLSESKTDYQISISIQTSKEQLFAALTKDLGKWWGHMDSPITKAGDVFKVSWNEPWYQFKVMSMEQNKLLVWECVDANQIIEGLDDVQKEWVGTSLHWKIEAFKAGEIKLHFLHEGLVPTFNCFDFCSSTWDRFITQGLKNYLEA